MDKPSASRAWQPWALVAGLLLFATALCAVLEPYVSLTSQAMVYVLAVVIAAYRADWLPSVLGAVGAVTALNFFFVPPRWTFEVDNREHLIALGVMLVVALVISRLASSLRLETETARRNEARAHQMQTLAVALADVQSAGSVQTLGQKALDTAFAGPNLLALAGSDAGPLTQASWDPAISDALRACMRERAVLGPGTGRWPGLGAWYVPLLDQGGVYGAACVRPAAAADESGREHAQALCALLAQALGRLQAGHALQVAEREAERQQLQGTFLAAISHDLRTPLAAIVAAATSLQTQRERLDAAAQDRLLAGIVSEAEYLGSLSDNTLQLVRLGTPGQVLQCHWESLEEIVGAVLARVRQRDAGQRISVHVADGLPLVRADAVLLAQLLSNLLDNALQHGEGEIEVTVQRQADVLELCVSDRGPGIAEGEREAVFRPYVRGDHGGHRGTGLGLAVCQAIARAHQGELLLRPRSGGGSSFCLQLPLEPQPAGPEDA